MSPLLPESALSRRAFLARSAKAGLACAAAGWAASAARAIEPFRRPGPPRFRFSLVGYSFREYFQHPPSGQPFTLFDLIDYAAEQGFGGVELTGYYFPGYPNLPDPDYVAAVRRHLYLRGLSASGTSVGNELGIPHGPKLDAQKAAVKAWVDVAEKLGAPYIRVFANGIKRMVVPGALEGAIEGFQECAEYAGRRGIFIGLENDGNIPPEMVMTIARRVQSRWFGLNLDCGNWHTADVYGDVQRAAPYAINVHWKTIVTQADGIAHPADLARYIRILRGANYEGWLGFEYEGTNDPRTVIPDWLARTKAAIAAQA